MVRVRVDRPEVGAQQVAETGADGRVSFVLPAGPYRLIVLARGWLTNERAGELSNRVSTTVLVELQSDSKTPNALPESNEVPSRGPK